MKSEPCVRSGFCCKVATCAAGVASGAPQRGCTFLKGSGPGDYECDLVRLKPELADAMAIGAGCGSTMFNRDRDTAIQREVAMAIDWKKYRSDEFSVDPQKDRLVFLQILIDRLGKEATVAQAIQYVQQFHTTKGSN